MGDFAIICSDPAFGGGGRALTEALWRAAEEIGREPDLNFLRNRRVRRLGAPGAELGGRGVPQVLPPFDAANVLAAAAMMAPRVRTANTRFVCATAASYGYSAVLARRPFGCWVATSLADEWRARRPALDGARRAALAAGAPLLLACERATLRGARVLWAISPASRRALALAARLPEDRIRVVPIPVDAQRFAPLDDDEWTRGLEQPRLIFVGRASDPRKNLALLLDAFERLRSRLPAVRLTLVGAPPTQQLPDGVDVLGEMPSVSEPLRRASLFVLPSLQEGFGLVVAEALASGVPAIVTPSGGPEELVRDSGGGEVLSGFEADELAQRVEALLSDRDRLVAMRRRGHAYVVREHDPAHLRVALQSALEELHDG
jgi:glycosyltransferase involved in cell wall biosynthesis